MDISRLFYSFLFFIVECSEGGRWASSDYISLHAPQSQCISLQWTYRDETVVNLPITLLVEGDVILLRPGQKVPVKCKKCYVSISKVCLCTDGTLCKLHTTSGVFLCKILSWIKNINKNCYIVKNTKRTTMKTNSAIEKVSLSWKNKNR